MGQIFKILMAFSFIVEVILCFKAKEFGKNRLEDKYTIGLSIRNIFSTGSDIYVINRSGGEVYLPESENPRGQIILILAPSTIKNVGTNPYLTKIIAESPACFERTFNSDRQSKVFLKTGTYAKLLVELNGEKETLTDIQLTKQPKLKWIPSPLCKLKMYSQKKCIQLQDASNVWGKWGYVRVVPSYHTRFLGEQCPAAVFNLNSNVIDFTLKYQSTLWKIIEQISKEKLKKGADEFVIKTSALEEAVVPSENQAGQVVTMRNAPNMVYFSSLNPKETIIINRVSATLNGSSNIRPINVSMPPNRVKGSALWVIDGGEGFAKLQFYQR